MPETTLVAETGRKLGSRPSRRLLAAGKIPAVVYGHGTDPVAVAVDARELRTALRGEAGVNALLDLQIDGSSHLAMARQLQRHPVRGTVVHVDFQVVNRDEQMSVDVPIQLVGESVPVNQAGGVVDQELYAVTVTAKPSDVPNYIEFDISGLTPGDNVRAGDLALPAGVTLATDEDTVVLTARGAEAMSTVEGDEPAEATAADAAGDADTGDAGGA